MNCACGKPLHYLDPKNQLRVQALVDKLGEFILVTVGNKTWMVQRHFIALHGLSAAELPEIAEKYGFKKV